MPQFTMWKQTPPGPLRNTTVSLTKYCDPCCFRGVEIHLNFSPLLGPAPYESKTKNQFDVSCSWRAAVPPSSAPALMKPTWANQGLQDDLERVWLTLEINSGLQQPSWNSSGVPRHHKRIPRMHLHSPHDWSCMTIKHSYYSPSFPFLPRLYIEDRI